MTARVEIAASLWVRLRGLVGRDGHGGMLMLAPCRDIHTFTMDKPIDVAFVSAEGVVLEAYRGVAPHRRLRNKQAAAVVERYSTAAPWFVAGDELELRSTKERKS